MRMSSRYGDSTRSLKAVRSPAVPGQPVAPLLALASTYHLSTDEAADLDAYRRSSNPTSSNEDSPEDQQPTAGLEDSTTSPSSSATDSKHDPKVHAHNTLRSHLDEP